MSMVTERASRLGFLWIVAGIWLFALGSIGLGIYTLSQRIEESRLAAIQSAERDLSNLTRVSQEHAIRTLRSADQVIQFVRARYLEVGDKLNLAELSDQGVIDAEIFNQVGVIDAKGIYAFSNRPLVSRVDLSDREHFQVHVAQDSGKLFVSQPVLGRTTQKWSLQLTRRINRKDGSFGGVVVVSLDPAYIGRFYGELNLGRSGVSALYGTEGIARVRRIGNSYEYGSDASKSPAIKALREGKLQGSFTNVSVVDGTERLYFFRKVPGYDLAVIAGLGMDDLLEDYRRSADIFRTQALVAAVLLLALATALTWHLWQIRIELRAKQHAKDRLQERTNQLNAILELSPDGFVSFDQQRRVQYVNPAFLAMTQLDAQRLNQLSEQDFSALLSNQCCTGARFSGIAALKTRILAKQPNASETIEIGQQERRTLQVGIRMGSLEAISQILYLHDVTREAEIDQMKSDFLATAAHELRTPMASVFGFSEVLLTQKLEPAEQKELLEIVYGQSLAMSEILNELLDLARIEARRGKDFRFNYVCIQTVLTELSKSIKIPAGRHPPALTMPAQEVWLMADTGKLKQALGNVINNAYKYSPGGGVVEVKVQVLPATPSEPQRIAVLVSDCGMGMTADQTRRVFERFFRADTSGKIPGTGLGMSIVKEIVDLHQGQVTVTSQVGQGTSVHLIFPQALQTPPVT